MPRSRQGIDTKEVLGETRNAYEEKGGLFGLAYNTTRSTLRLQLDKFVERSAIACRLAVELSPKYFAAIEHLPLCRSLGIAWMTGGLDWVVDTQCTVVGCGLRHRGLVPLLTGMTNSQAGRDWKTLLLRLGISVKYLRRRREVTG